MHFKKKKKKKKKKLYYPLSGNWGCLLWAKATAVARAALTQSYFFFFFSVQRVVSSTPSSPVAVRTWVVLHRSSYISVCDPQSWLSRVLLVFAVPSPTSVCWVFSCFRNPPNTQGLGTSTVSQHNICDSEGKTLRNSSCAPSGVQTSGLWISRPMLYQLTTPVLLYCPRRE